ncbi:unnamed protein product [Amoebophrya sp. A25]|nr:unnamed protein product [Amoebophrya sp. A25]|eukprot:GSA25T00008833001.1
MAPVNLNAQDSSWRLVLCGASAVLAVVMAGKSGLTLREIRSLWKRSILDRFWAAGYIARIAFSGETPRSADGFYAGPICARRRHVLPEGEIRAGGLQDGGSFFSLSSILGNKNWRHLLWLEWNRVRNVLAFPAQKVEERWLYAGGPLAHVRTQQQIGTMMEQMDKAFDEVGVHRQHLVLLGGGHSHVHVLKMLAMQPLRNTRVTLISKDVMTPYSGMLPGHVGGMYSKREAHLDLFRLARFARVRFIVGEVEKIDFGNRELHLKPTRNTVQGEIRYTTPGDHGEEVSITSPIDGQIGGRGPSSSTRPPVKFDVLSINVGSVPEMPNDNLAKSEHITAVKPIDRLSNAWTKVQKQDFKKICIVGGGAAGVEMAFAMNQTLNFDNCKGKDDKKNPVQILLLHTGEELLPGHGAPARKLVTELLAEKQIQVHTDCTADKVVPETKQLVTKEGERFKFEHCIWCTGGRPPVFLTDSLKKHRFLQDEKDGTLLVNTHMQSVSDPDVFGAGDCVTIEGHKRPKAGVFAVMAGMTLFNNLRIHMENKLSSPSTKKPFENYFPQTEWLGLLNLCDGTALASRGENLAVRGSWLLELKDYIDRKWMAQYGGDGLPRMLPELNFGNDGGLAEFFKSSSSTSASDRIRRYLNAQNELVGDPSMRCGGCACKLGGQVLKKGLGKTSSTSTRDHLSSTSRSAFGRIEEAVGEDCAVISYNTNITTTASAETEDENASQMTTYHTVDFFKAGVLDIDPFVFGQVSALHCLSDLIAMGVVLDKGGGASSGTGASHVTALSTCAVPLASEPLQADDFAMLSQGARSLFSDYDTQIVGGHSIEGDLALGFTVNAAILNKKDKQANPSSAGNTSNTNRIWTKGRAVRDGDLIVVTKPLGTGIIQAAVMRNACAGDVYLNCLQSMLTRNSALVVSKLQECVAKLQKRSADDEVGVTGCTDITGFGFLGHLLEMLGSSSSASTTTRRPIAEIDVSSVPILEGALDLVSDYGILSSLFPKNLALVHEEVEGLRLRRDEKSSCAEGSGKMSAFQATPDFALIDPQTSGGLLLTMSPQVYAMAKNDKDAGSSMFLQVVGKIKMSSDGETERSKKVRLIWKGA